MTPGKMLSGIAEGLVEALENVEGLRVSAYPVDMPNPPHAVVQLATTSYHASFGDASGITPGWGWTITRWQVLVIVGTVAQRSSVARLYDLLDPSGPPATSIPSALEDDRTLGGRVTHVKVIGVSSIGASSGTDDGYMVARLDLEVSTDAD